MHIIYVVSIIIRKQVCSAQISQIPVKSALLSHKTFFFNFKLPEKLQNVHMNLVVVSYVLYKNSQKLK